MEYIQGLEGLYINDETAVTRENLTAFTGDTRNCPADPGICPGRA